MLNIICIINTPQAIRDSYSEYGLIMFLRDMNAEGRSLIISSHRNIGLTFFGTNDLISLVYLPHCNGPNVSFKPTENVRSHYYV
jgi:hypothetical protein